MEATVLSAADQAWIDAAQQIADMKDREPWRVFNMAPGIEGAFKIDKRSVTCVDEGITCGIHLPGSGVLMTESERRAAIIAAGIEEFTTHDNCGAYALAFPGEQDPNAACRRWGKIEARKLGLPHRHIEAHEMERPNEFHNAIAVYYDGTGAFNRMPGLPPGFVVSRKHFGTAKDDLALCLKIAFGGHGFGDRFARHAPFWIVPLAHPKDRSLSLDTLEAEAKEIAKAYGDRVKVAGLKTAWHMRDIG